MQQALPFKIIMLVSKENLTSLVCCYEEYASQITFLLLSLCCIMLNIVVGLLRICSIGIVYIVDVIID